MSVKALLLLLSVGLSASSADAAEGPTRINVEPFIELPSGVRHPESITADEVAGELYVGTFDARMPEAARNNQLLRYSRGGQLLGRRSFGATPLTGIEYYKGSIYVLNFGASKLQRIEARFNEDSRIEDLVTFGALSPAAPGARSIANPDGSADEVRFGAAGIPAINGMTFDRQGHLYVSDSFQGAIYRIENASTCDPCTSEIMVRDPLLATAGALPFGANGLAFNSDATTLYVNNAGDGRVLQMRMPSGPLSILAESIHGADGLMMRDELLWVAANQADAVVAIDQRGRERYRATGFDGIGKDGQPLGLLFPASTVALGDWMVVANLALPLTEAVDDEWEESVTRWSLSRFKIPK